VLPGRLSVSRTIGDAEAKLPSLGGMAGVVIPIPEIKAFKINEAYDFILLASDGVFDKMTNKEMVHAAWQLVNPDLGLHKACGQVVEGIIDLALKKRTMDNVSVVIIALPFFKRTITS